MQLIAGHRMTVSEAAREGRLRTLESAMIDCMKRWATLHPNEAVNISRQTRFFKDTEARTDGFGPDRNMRMKGQIPYTLHLMLQKEIDHDWLQQEQLVNMFFRLFKIGLVRKGDMKDRWNSSL